MSTLAQNLSVTLRPFYRKREQQSLPFGEEEEETGKSMLETNRGGAQTPTAPESVATGNGSNYLSCYRELSPNRRRRKSKQCPRLPQVDNSGEISPLTVWLHANDEEAEEIPCLAEEQGPTAEEDPSFEGHSLEEFLYCSIVSSRVLSEKPASTGGVSVPLSVPKLQAVPEDPDPDFLLPTDAPGHLLPCSICSRTISTSELFQHLRAHMWKATVHPYQDDPNYNTCGHCFVEKPTREDLIKHQVMLEQGVTRYCCMICLIAFYTDEERMEHMRELHPRHTTPYICQLCPFRCSTKLQIQTHLSNYHPKSAYCDICLLIFEKAADYTITKFTNPLQRAEDASAVCKDIRRHLWDHFLRPFGAHCCSACSLAFVSRSDLSKHKKEGHTPLKGGVATSQPTSLQIPPNTQLVPFRLSRQHYLKVQKYQTNGEMMKKFTETSSTSRPSHKEMTNRDNALIEHVRETVEAFLPVEGAIDDAQSTVSREFRLKSAPASCSAVASPATSSTSTDDDERSNHLRTIYLDGSVTLTGEMFGCDLLCDECELPISEKGASEGGTAHYALKPLCCSFPGCSFRTFCYEARERHTHAEMGTRKDPRLQLDEASSSKGPEASLWLCDSCTLYFTDLRAVGCHVHEARHIGFHSVCGHLKRQPPTLDHPKESSTSITSTTTSTPSSCSSKRHPKVTSGKESRQSLAHSGQGRNFFK